jgi:hypothetical protein
MGTLPLVFTSVITHLRRQPVAFLALLVALGGTSYAGLRSPKPPKPKNATLYACVKTGQRTLTLAKRGPRCPKGQRMVAWNGRGRRGPAGDTGPAGARGPAGADAALGAGSINSLTLFGPDVRDGAAGTATLRSLGTSATQAAAGNDPRLSDARTPSDSSVTAAKFAALPHAQMRQSAACQSLTAGVFQPVRFDSMPFGSGVTFNNADDSLTLTTAGTYLITGQVNWSLAQNNGNRALEIFAGLNQIAYDGRLAPDAVNTGENVSALINAAAGTTIRASAGQTNAGANALAFTDVGGLGCATLSVQWVGP